MPFARRPLLPVQETVCDSRFWPFSDLPKLSDDVRSLGVDRKSSADGENDANDSEPTISRFLDFGLVTGQREFQDQL
jgi:hypothetical protein